MAVFPSLFNATPKPKSLLVAPSAARMARELDDTEAKGEPPADKTSAAYYLWQTSPPRIRNRRPRAGIP